MHTSTLPAHSWSRSCQPSPRCPPWPHPPWPPAQVPPPHWSLGLATRSWTAPGTEANSLYELYWITSRHCTALLLPVIVPLSRQEVASGELAAGELYHKVQAVGLLVAEVLQSPVLGVPLGAVGNWTQPGVLQTGGAVHREYWWRSLVMMRQMMNLLVMAGLCLE